jgi:hypothetical protein
MRDDCGIVTETRRNNKYLTQINGLYRINTQKPKLNYTRSGGNCKPGRRRVLFPWLRINEATVKGVL